MSVTLLGVARATFTTARGVTTHTALVARIPTRGLPMWARRSMTTAPGMVVHAPDGDAVAEGERFQVARGDRPRVVVLGTGWGCFAAAKKLDRDAFDVHIVSPRNHMVFTPLLASSAVGTLEFRGVAEPVRSSISNVRFHLGKCRAIDPTSRTVTVVTKPERPSNAVMQGTVPTTQYDIEYDALIIGVGARSNTFGIPGVEEHVHFMKELSDARGIRKGITECLETASHESLSEAERRRLLHFVVVGGGPTGVEFSAELSDFIYQDIVRYYPELKSDISVTLIEGREILSSFDATLREYAMKRLKSGHVFVRTGGNVKDVTATEIHMDDGETIPYGLCVWSTGVGPRKLTSLLDDKTFAKTPAQRLAVDPKLRVFRSSRVTWANGQLKHTSSGRGDIDMDQASASFEAFDPDARDVFPGVYALGDCAHVLGGNYAPIAQVAERQGLWVADQLNSLHARGHKISESAPRDLFSYKHIGSLAYLGRYMALSDFTGSDYEGVRGARLRGWASWFFWRSAYLSSLGSWRNRLQVPMDWLRTFLFGRDINSF